MLIEHDDDRVQRIQRLFSSAALHWGQVRIKDGAGAIHHMIFEGFPDLVITRLETPKFDAVDVAEWLGGIKCTKPVPIVVFDLIDDQQLIERLSQLGVRDCINFEMPEKQLRKVFQQNVAQVELHFHPPDVAFEDKKKSCKPGYLRSVTR